MDESNTTILFIRKRFQNIRIENKNNLYRESTVEGMVESSVIEQA
jgi:hypothetical protein